VLRHRKFRQYLSESFAKISALKIESFQKLSDNFQNFGKNCKIYFHNFEKNEGENIGVYVISQLFFEGEGILFREEAKYCRNIRQKFMQNFGKMLRVQNFIKSATLLPSFLLTYQSVNDRGS